MISLLPLSLVIVVLCPRLIKLYAGGELALAMFEGILYRSLESVSGYPLRVKAYTAVPMGSYQDGRCENTRR